METIKINFVDFWKGFTETHKTNNYFYDLLKTKYRVEITPDPDILFYSVFGKEHRKYKCTRIFYTGENIRPPYDECDYAFSFDYSDNPKNYRLPLYGLYLGQTPETLIKPTDFDPEAILREKSGFCNFVYSNTKAKKRIEFFHKLSKYKPVASGGRVLNNVGGRVPNKREFIRNFKFTIAFENSSYPGYTTEKLIEPMLVNSMPIYWGNDLVGRDFNPASFINYHDYPDDEAVIEQIIKLDQNDDLYLKILSEPYYHQNQVNEFIRTDRVLERFIQIIETPIIPVARQKKKRFWIFSV